jgi:DsbC/DsbD-like thiol-disulfide interchange protein
MRYVFAPLALCALTALPLQAGDRFAAPVTAEVLPGWIQEDGSRMAALRLTLEPGWKTYWRAPGDAGIPPQFDWSASRNLGAVSIEWPAPKVFDQSGLRSIGYEDTLVLPLRIEPATAGAPVRVRAEMQLGVCSDVCVPYELQFDAEIADDNRKPTPAIAAALAQRPYSASEAGVRGAKCIVSPTTQGLQIEVRVTMPSAGDPEHVVIEPGAGEIWVSEARTKRHGDSVVAFAELVHVTGGPIALDRSSVRITVLGSKHAVDIEGCTAG